jgi:uncharacterized protein (AIM24 family)
MFCTQCGARIVETANFCGGCGAQIKRAAPPAPASSATPPPVAEYSAPDPPPAPPSPIRSEPVIANPPLHSSPSAAAVTKCSWCGATIDGAPSNCLRCGATLNLPQLVAKSGWTQLPARKDMAKLQFGDSFCQIEGLYVPVADVNLAAGDSVYFSHHVLLWKDSHIQIEPMSLRGAWTRVFAGLPLIMTQARGPGHVAFSKDLPGELIPIPIQPGESIDVREHLFLAATGQVVYDWFQSGVWFETRTGDDREMHYPVGQFMDRFSTGAEPGLLLLHAGGNVFTRHLGHHETILVKPTAMIFKDPTVQMHLHFERPNMGFVGWGNWSNRYLWLRMTGPGRVGIQSVFERIEGETRNLNRFSNATERRW